MEKREKSRRKFIIWAIVAFLVYSIIGSFIAERRVLGTHVPDIILRITPIMLIVIAILNLNKQATLTTIMLGIVSAIQLIPFMMVSYYLVTEFAFVGLLWWLALVGNILSFILLTLNSELNILGNKFWIHVLFRSFYAFISAIVFFSLGYVFIEIIRFVLGEMILGVGIVLFENALNIDNLFLKDTNKQENIDYGYCDMTKHILLLFFTGWIWQYIWIYRTSGYLSKITDEDKMNPTSKLLLCMFVPFYYIYWVYQTASEIEAIAKHRNIESNIVVLSVVISIFIGSVPPILLQSKLNQICESEKQNISYSKINIDKYNTDSQFDKTNEIRNYKKLLDEGIISEEEFQAKKKQLLGI